MTYVTTSENENILRESTFNGYNFQLHLLSSNLKVQKTKPFQGGIGKGDPIVSIIKYDW